MMSDMSDAPRMEDAVGSLPGSRNFRLLADIPVRMSVEVGSTPLKLAEVLDLAEGSVVELDRQADELLDIMVNGRSEEHTSELQSLMRISSAFFCFQKNSNTQCTNNNTKTSTSPGIN